MAKDVIHISEAEAASDFAALIARVRAGAKVIIENGARPVAVLQGAEPVRRAISECIALAKSHEVETGKTPFSILTSWKTWKKFSANVSRGTLQRGNNPRLKYHCRGAG